MAELRFLGFLADIAGKRTRHLDLENPKRLRELLPAEFPKTNVIVLVNEKACSFDSVIHNDDIVAIMPVISGG